MECEGVNMFNNGLMEESVRNGNYVKAKADLAKAEELGTNLADPNLDVI